LAKVLAKLFVYFAELTKKEVTHHTSNNLPYLTTSTLHQTFRFAFADKNISLVSSSFLTHRNLEAASTHHTHNILSDTISTQI
jgi:hypothetical protein